MKILEVKNLNVEINGIHILNDINFEVERGEILAIIGPNGAGKTILLKSLLGLIDYQGEIKWNKIYGEKIKIGYVPQRMDIETDIPLSVEEFLNLSGDSSKQKIKEAIKAVQLDEKILKSGFGEISIGQRQRILVAWAILGNPQVLLFDEPTADIDIAGQESIYKMLHKLHRDLNLSIILISHDLNVVFRYAHKAICLNRKKICEGSPKEILNTENLLELYGGEKAFYHHDHHH
ncbi:metal ABC transporter ATP-binding protein [Candidatus Wolfebacteria bacterium]|nr:metal ABC transporter ATP-binding protein [Candidatus Wolfebacteria bacterium]